MEQHLSEVLKSIAEMKTHIMYIKDRITSIESRIYEENKDKATLCGEIKGIRETSETNRKLIYWIMGLGTTMVGYLLVGGKL